MAEKTSYKLDPEEQEILKAFESGRLKPDKEDRIEFKKLQKAAQNKLNKDKRVNIRLSETDLKKLKSKALKAGIPYQTLIGLLIHQYANGKLTINI